MSATSLRRWGARALVVVAALSALVARAAEADAPPARGRAAVLVQTDAVDRFMETFVYEVAAGALVSAGFYVAPLRAAAERISTLHTSVGACVADDACLERLALLLETPAVFVVKVQRHRGRASRVVLELVPVVVSRGRVERRTTARVEGREIEVGERFRSVVTELAALPPLPCRLERATPVLDGAMVTLVVEGAAPAPLELPTFLAAGSHRLRVDARDMSPTTTTFTCDAGRRYRLRAH